MKVLVPYDGSEQSEYALTLATNASPGSTIHLVHVIEPFVDNVEIGGYTAHRYEQEEAHARAMMNTAAESLDGLQIETHVRYGRPAQEIVDLATESDIDEIVVGSRGREGARRLLLGSVAESVVRRASVPVTVVRGSEAATRDRPDRILVPFDGSEESKQALSHAIEQYPEAQITAVHVVYPPPELRGSDSETVPNELKDWTRNLDEHTESILDLAVDRADEQDRSIDTDTVAGDPARTIVEYATEHDTDHIVMGSSGRNGIKRLVLGSVAETVVRRAPTSVTVVR